MATLSISGIYCHSSRKAGAVERGGLRPEPFHPVWWGVIVAALIGVSSLVWQIKPWEAFEDEEPRTVKLIEGHAAAYAKDQWNAYLRIFNETSRAIVVERVTATFGARSYGPGCSKRVLYPVSQIRARSGLNPFERIRPGGGGAPFTGIPIPAACLEPSDYVPFP